MAIITLDEEERLPACIESVSFADEIVVVDSGSRDRTEEIAKSMGASVFQKNWNGFSQQKQYAVDQCSNEWVLILDADERIPGATAEVIKSIIEVNDNNVSAYSFRRKNFFHGKWIKHCGWWPDYIVRMVKKPEGFFDGSPVHEGWQTKGNIKRIDAIIEHLSFRNYSELVTKMEKYSSLAASALYKEKKTAGPFTPVLRGLWMFLRTYFLELGVLEGFDGFTISVMNGGGSFLKYAKLREMYFKKIAC